MKANDIGNYALAISAGILAYAANTADLKLAGTALAIGMAIKAVGSYITDHSTEVKPAA